MSTDNWRRGPREDPPENSLTHSYALDVHAWNANSASATELPREVPNREVAGATRTPTNADQEAINRFASHCIIFVLHHGAPPALHRPYLVPIHLGELHIPSEFQDNRLAESRFYLADVALAASQDYLGFATGSWDRKFSKVHRLEDLHVVEPLLAPNRVLAPCFIPDDRWVQLSENYHPGMDRLIQEMAEVSGVAMSGRPTFWANNFICHRDVYRDFLVVWRNLFDHFYQRYGFDPPFTLGSFDARRKFGYLAERFTILYFAAQPHLQVIPVPGP